MNTDIDELPETEIREKYLIEKHPILFPSILCSIVVGASVFFEITSNIDVTPSLGTFEGGIFAAWAIHNWWNRK